MAQRQQLQTKLEELLGSRYVYFQPPPNITMKYPCIVYHLSKIDTWHASNDLYKHAKRYALTYIDRNPESDVPDKLLRLPFCSFSRAYTTDGLNHYAYELYF